MKAIWIVGLLLLAGVVHSDPLPEWINAPTQDSTHTFYSVGSGPTIEEAKANALANLSMRLIVNVESETQSYSKLADGQLDQRLNQSTIQASEKMTFVKTNIINTFVAKNETHVNVSADKSEVFNTIKSDLVSTLMPLIKTDLSQSEIIANRLKFEQEIQHSSKFISLLRAYQQNVTALEAKIEHFVAVSNQLISETSFHVMASQIDKLGLVKSMSERLQKLGFSNLDKPHQLKVTLVGPQILYTVQNSHHAYKAAGEIYFSFNNEVILVKKIDEFEFSKDKSIAWTSMVTELTNLIPLR
jgi:hypothetical protein